MSKLSWGKPRLFIKDLEASQPSWKELNTPVQDTTEIQVTNGDKLEAPIEGGQNEEVKFKASTYEIVYNIRKLKGRTVPIANTDGVVSKHYALAVMPEDPTNIGFYVPDTTVSIDDSFTSQDGAIWQIQHDAITAASGNTVKWGTLSIVESKLKFTETHLPEGQTEAATFEETVTELS